MATIDEQIKSLEEEISKTKYNKATQGHIGKLKAKIAALREKKEKAQAHAKSSGGGPGFEVKKSGDASVALVGFPSVGKSSLICQLTDVESEAGNFAFTTLTCIPGVLHHRGATIQILDLPGLIKGAAEGKGRGPKDRAPRGMARAATRAIDAPRFAWWRRRCTLGERPSLWVSRLRARPGRASNVCARGPPRPAPRRVSAPIPAESNVSTRGCFTGTATA